MKTELKKSYDWLIIALAYPALMALLWLSTKYKYVQLDSIIKTRWWYILLLAVAMIAFAKYKKIKVSFSKRISIMFLLFALPIAIMCSAATLAFYRSNVNWGLAFVLLFGTLFIGIGEEIAYRGIVFNSIARNRSVFATVMYSSLLFSLMHGVNIMKRSAENTKYQLIQTFLIGLCFAWVYVTTKGNIYLPILLHWLYDAALITPLATDAPDNRPIYTSTFINLIAIGFTIYGWFKYRKKNWADVRKN